MTNSTRTFLISTVLVAGSLLTSLVTTPAGAFWNIWNRIEPVPCKSDCSGGGQPLKNVRQDQCGRSDAIKVFGENAFMRGEFTRRLLPNNVARSIAAAYVAETPAKARSLLSPLLQAPDTNVSSAARISLAFVLFRRGGLDGTHLSEINALVEEPVVPALEADRYYILAAIALSRRDWVAVAINAKNALEIVPNYYNAQVLFSLSQLQMIGQELAQTGCRSSSMIRIEKLLLPLLRLGACPTHVAHFDLSAERYLTLPKGRTTKQMRLIRRAYLAYVSRNDIVGRKVIQTYGKSLGRDACLARLMSLDFSSQPDASAN